MPYNNTPIPRPKEITGQVELPLARTKRILSVDPDLGNVSNTAVFAITTATEEFVRYLTEQTQNVVKAERKPRRNIQYRDVANAVARHDNLEFLTDVVPKTVTYKAHKEKRAKEVNAIAEQSNVQTVPDAIVAGPTVTSPAAELQEERPDVMDIDTVTGGTRPDINGLLNGGPD